jgi:hypothetical protein
MTSGLDDNFYSIFASHKINIQCHFYYEVFVQPLHIPKQAEINFLWSNVDIQSRSNSNIPYLLKKNNKDVNNLMTKIIRCLMSDQNVKFNNIVLFLMGKGSKHYTFIESHINQKFTKICTILTCFLLKYNIRTIDNINDVSDDNSIILFKRQCPNDNFEGYLMKSKQNQSTVYIPNKVEETELVQKFKNMNLGQTFNKQVNIWSDINEMKYHYILFHTNHDKTMDLLHKMNPAIASISKTLIMQVLGNFNGMKYKGIQESYRASLWTKLKNTLKVAQNNQDEYVNLRLDIKEYNILRDIIPPNFKGFKRFETKSLKQKV